ncbi:MAG: HD domain-containing protein [Gemmatimonadota bacterium]
MTINGYSDRINHAFAFAAKYHVPRDRRRSGSVYLTHPANVAVILARYGSDEVTIVSGILSYVLEAVEPHYRDPLDRKITEKFGPSVAVLVRNLIEPKFDSRGKERGWEACKLDCLVSLSEADPRALEVCAATQIHLCGSTLADVRRLGVEYLATFSSGSAEQVTWWYRSVLETLSARSEWHRRIMLEELRELAQELAAELKYESTEGGEGGF